jgi:hypothetical protein
MAGKAGGECEDNREVELVAHHDSWEEVGSCAVVENEDGLFQE